MLASAVETGRVAGIEVAIFNLQLDPDRDVARVLTDALVAGP